MLTGKFRIERVLLSRTITAVAGWNPILMHALPRDQRTQT